MEFRNPFNRQYRWAIVVGLSVATVVLLVLVYRATAPRSAQTTAPSGDRIAESEVLQVGALPVT